MAVFLEGLLLLSLLGSLLTALLLLLGRLLRGRVSCRLLYYLWLPVLLRLCLPLGVTLSLPLPPPPEGTLYAYTVITTAPAESAPFPPARPEGNDPAEPPAQPSPAPPRRDLCSSPAFWAALWGMGAAVSLAWYWGGYLRFSRQVRRSLREAPPAASRLLREMDPGGRVRLGTSPLAEGPVLLGAVRPLILLPAGLEKEGRLRDILAHELTHARRRDLLYKWFAAAVTSLHWFNPVMLLLRRELSRLCELSCDEAVTAGMDGAGRRHYGETLLALAAPSRRAGPLTATLCEEKDRLRERLEAIVRGRKRGAAALTLSLLTAAAVSGCALIAGAEAAIPAEDPASTPDLRSVWVLYREALRGTRDIRYIGQDGEERQVTVDDIPGLFSPDSDYAAIWRFALVDLDGGNSEEEAVLQIIDAAGDMGGFLILHREGNEVCAFPQDYRCFEALKADGTFTFQNPTGTGSGVGRVRFRFGEGVRECGIEPLLWQELDPATGEETFLADRQEVTREAYDLAADRQDQKKDVFWYGFTPENIDLAFSGVSVSRLLADRDLSDIAAALEGDFEDYWAEVSDGMVLPKVELFQSTLFDGMDRAVFLVYPEYRASHTVAYSVTGSTVRRLGDFPSGLEFALSPERGGMLRTGWQLEDHGRAETFSTYYAIGPEGVRETLALSVYTGSGGEALSWTRYQDGEGTGIAREEYEAQKTAADGDFLHPEFVSFVSGKDLAEAGLDISGLSLSSRKPDRRAGASDRQQLKEFLEEELGAASGIGAPEKAWSETGGQDWSTTILPVDLAELAEGDLLRLGTYEMQDGDQVAYNLTAEEGPALSVGFIQAESATPDPTYCTVTNYRTDGETRVSTAFIPWEGSLVEPGEYILFLRAPAGALTGVKGSIVIRRPLG